MLVALHHLSLIKRSWNRTHVSGGARAAAGRHVCLLSQAQTSPGGLTDYSQITRTWIWAAVKLLCHEH